MKRAIRKPYGMILANGPTSSGKTTTLYTILKELNKDVETTDGDEAADKTVSPDAVMAGIGVAQSTPASTLDEVDAAL